MFGSMCRKELLGTLILQADYLLHLLVDEFRRIVAIGLYKALLGIVIAEIGETLAHSHIGNHAIGPFRHLFEVVHGSGGDVSGKELFGSASGECGADFVEHLLAGHDAPFFGEVPCSAESLSAGDNRNLDEGVCIFQEPTYGGMSRLVQGDAAFFVLRHHLGLAFKTSNYAVDGIEEVLLVHTLVAMTCGYQGGLVADVGNVGARKSRCLTGKELDVEA